MQLFSNNAASTLASAITVGSTALTVFAGEGIKFPAPVAPDFALVTLYQKSGTTEINHEIVMVTARTGDVMTITRAQEGTTARSFNAGDAVELRWTAGSAGMLQEYPLSAVAGTNVITANATPTLTAQAMTGTMWKLAAAGANTGAVTLNINGMGAVPVVQPDGSALLAGDILAAGYPCLLLKRAADFVLLNSYRHVGPVTGGIQLPIGMTGLLRSDAGVLSNVPAALIAYTQINASNAAWAPNAATKYLYIECIGGGGGSAGNYYDALGNGYIAPGGGSGGISRGFFIKGAASYAVTIGAGGVAGAASVGTGGGVGGGAGGVGGTSAFGALISVAGGGGSYYSGVTPIFGAAGVGGFHGSLMGDGGGAGGGAAWWNSTGGSNAQANTGGGGSGDGGAQPYAGRAGGSGVIRVWEFA